jgi:nicotinate-nucleotide adenylyltransferase
MRSFLSLPVIRRIKGRTVTEASDRLMMCILATITNPYFKVSEIEIKRGGYSYTYDTVMSFLEQYEHRCDIFFITGSDATLEISTWKNIELLMENCTFIAATRPGFIMDEKTEEKLYQFLNKKLYFMEIPALSISSTDIRKRIAEHHSIKYLVPESVEKFIEKRGLYKNKEDQ